jgi:hypothetical protein
MDEDRRNLLFNRMSEWKAAKAALDAATETEKAVRMQIHDEFFAEAAEGLNKIGLGTFYNTDGVPFRHELHMEIKVNRTLDAKPFMKAITDKTIKAADVKDVVSFKPSFSPANWRKLLDAREALREAAKAGANSDGSEEQSLAPVEVDPDAPKMDDKILEIFSQFVKEAPGTPSIKHHMVEIKTE